MNKISTFLLSLLLMNTGCLSASAQNNLSTTTLRDSKINSTRLRTRDRTKFRRQPQNRLVLVKTLPKGKTRLFEVLANNNKIASFNQLKKYDGNKDGKVNSSDTSFSKLMIKDLKRNDPGAFLSAGNFGLASINTSSSSQLYTDNKGKFKKGVYTCVNGEQGEVREYKLSAGKERYSPTKRYEK